MLRIVISAMRVMAYTLQRLATRLYPAHLWQETRGRIFVNWQEAYTLIHI